MKKLRNFCLFTLQLGFGACLMSTAARAATFTVINTNTAGTGSLSNAIVQANTTLGADVIDFNIPGSGVHTIFLSNSLPAITNTVVIDGYTQPGSSPNTLANGNNAVLLIELNGGGRNIDGLVFRGRGSNCVVRGLVLNGFDGTAAINFNFGSVVTSSNVVEGCFIGTDPSGSIARGPNSDGVRMNNCNGNTIGGITPGARNLISANSVGVRLVNSGTNVVQGNFIGTDKDGANALPNVSFGVSIEFGAHNATIGGTTPAARNVIAEGLRSTSDSGHGHVIQGNYIGLDVTGTKLLSPLATPVTLSSSFCLIGGITATPGVPPGNVIAGGSINNISIFSASSVVNNIIQGNLVGTDVTGTRDLGNAGAGVNLGGGVFNTLIGGTNAGAANVISGHDDDGIFLGPVSPGNARSNVIQGNLIGTDITGRNPLPNATATGSGIRVEEPHNTIGPGNIIAFNGGDGISINNAVNLTNRITANSIFANAGLGIDLGVNGPNQNDAGDLNAFQNFPVLTNVIVSPGNVTFHGFLPSAPNTTYRLEFFANDSCDPSGFGEGQQYLGSTNVTTDPTGTNFFSFTAAAELPCQAFGTATAINPDGNTSEFSALRSFTGVDTDGDGACDVDELLAATDPNNPASVFRITGIMIEGSDIRVTWQAAGGRTNMLQTTARLVGDVCTNNFTDVPPALELPGSGDVFTNHVHIGGATNRAQYYRVRLVR